MKKMVKTRELHTRSEGPIECERECVTSVSVQCRAASHLAVVGERSPYPTVDMVTIEKSASVGSRSGELWVVQGVRAASEGA